MGNNGKICIRSLSYFFFQLYLQLIVTARKLRDENSMLKRRDLKPVEVRDAVAATFQLIDLTVDSSLILDNQLISVILI